MEWKLFKVSKYSCSEQNVQSNEMFSSVTFNLGLHCLLRQLYLD